MMDESIVTFCMPLKQRSQRAIKSVRSLLQSVDGHPVSLSICEDVSEGNMDLVNLSPSRPVTHWWVATGFKWNRSLLLNYSFKRASTPLVATWDADFIFPANFGTRLIKKIADTDWDREYIRIGVTETEDTQMVIEKIPKGHIWGGLYVYQTDKVREIMGYDERFVNHGHEERDFNDRYRLKYGVREGYIEESGFVWHVSHSNKIRAEYSDANRYLRERNQKDGVIITNQQWGEAQMVREWRKS